MSVTTWILFSLAATNIGLLRVTWLLIKGLEHTNDRVDVLSSRPNCGEAVDRANPAE